MQSILERMREIEREHGREEFEGFDNEGPAEYRSLEARHGSRLNELAAAAFSALAPAVVRDLKLGDSTRFDELRERGRRTIFHRDDVVAATVDIAEAFEAEAKQCAESGAYYAATVFLGSASEARLMLRALRSKSKLAAILAEIPKKKGRRVRIQRSGVSTS